MAELGWVRLPKDANGEYVRVGDDMETTHPALAGEHSEVEYLTLTADGWEVDGESPTSMRHYHAPTVEDVLVDFFKACQTHASELGFCTDESKETAWRAIAADYAEKLRLAGDGE